VYLPVLLYACAGPLTVEDVPSPKFQDQEVGDPVLTSVKLTVNGAFPDVGEAEKAATGVLTLLAKTVMALDSESVPFTLLTVSVTVRLPAVE
jgi:hypothetical protein